MRRPSPTAGCVCRRAPSMPRWTASRARVSCTTTGEEVVGGRRRRYVGLTSDGHRDARTRGAPAGRERAPRARQTQAGGEAGGGADERRAARTATRCAGIRAGGAGSTRKRWSARCSMSPTRRGATPPRAPSCATCDGRDSRRAPTSILPGPIRDRVAGDLARCGYRSRARAAHRAGVGGMGRRRWRDGPEPPELITADGIVWPVLGPPGPVGSRGARDPRRMVGRRAPGAARDASGEPDRGHRARRVVPAATLDLHARHDGPCSR